jgi:hypothetical protein
MQTNLTQTTTYPPILYADTAIGNDTVFYPQAHRDTDAPDCGYHYFPLDYLFGGCDAYANLTFAPGTSVGWFRTSEGYYHSGHGIHIGDGYTLTFNGTQELPDYWVRRNTVQEGVTGVSEGHSGTGGITSWTWPDFSQAGRLRASSHASPAWPTTPCTSAMTGVTSTPPLTIANSPRVASAAMRRASV